LDAEYDGIEYAALPIEYRIFVVMMCATHFVVRSSVRKYVAYLLIWVYDRDSIDIVWRLAVGSALNEPLPVNSTDWARALLRLEGVTRNDDVSADLALLPPTADSAVFCDRASPENRMANATVPVQLAEQHAIRRESRPVTLDQ
jgi:hypothetical protein